MTDSSSRRKALCPSTEGGPLRRQQGWTEAGRSKSRTQRNPAGPRPEGSLLLLQSLLWAQPCPAWLVCRVLEATCSRTLSLASTVKVRVSVKKVIATTMRILEQMDCRIQSPPP